MPPPPPPAPNVPIEADALSPRPPAPPPPTQHTSILATLFENITFCELVYLTIAPSATLSIVTISVLVVFLYFDTSTVLVLIVSTYGDTNVTELLSATPLITPSVPLCGLPVIPLAVIFGNGLLLTSTTFIVTTSEL